MAQSCLYLKRRNIVTDITLKTHLDFLIKRFPKEVLDNAKRSPFTDSDQIEEAYVEGDMKALVALNQAITSAILELKRAERNLKISFESANYYDEIQYKLKKKIGMKQNICFKSTVEPLFLKVLAYFTSILSVYVVISELLIMF